MAGEGIVSLQTLVFSVTKLSQLKFMWPNQLQQLPHIKLAIEINNIKKIYIVILPILGKVLGKFCPNLYLKTYSPLHELPDFPACIR